MLFVNNGLQLHRITCSSGIENESLILQTAINIPGDMPGVLYLIALHPIESMSLQGQPAFLMTFLNYAREKYGLTRNNLLMHIPCGICKQAG